jgi:hypothetical protein
MRLLGRERRDAGGAGGLFLYANAGDKGYYRTAYAPEHWKAIEANAETGLTPPERIGLLGDRWALMQAGQGTVGEFLDLALAVKQDPNATVLDSALGKVDRDRVADCDRCGPRAAECGGAAGVWAGVCGAGRAAEA